MDEIEERKEYQAKTEFANKKRERDIEEQRKLEEELEKQQSKQWESSRDKRVKNWNKFNDKIKSGNKKCKYETRPPHYRQEERTTSSDLSLYRPYTG